MSTHVQIPTGGDIDQFEHLFDLCAFIKLTPDGRDFWAMEPTGNYADDVATGCECGWQLLGVLRRRDCDDFTRQTLLGWTLAAMAKKGETCHGHLVGFAKVVSRALPRWQH